MAQEQQATLAGGCFWCTEAVFNDVIGVTRVESGYTGGHAEAIRIHFDPVLITYDDLLDIFFATHDPTQLNRQGNDIGTQYRSAIFPHSEDQEKAARAALERAQAEWDAPIVTTIEPLGDWCPAEDYHQEYFAREGDSNPYCMAVVAPKLRKFRKSFAERLKNQPATP